MVHFVNQLSGTVRNELSETPVRKNQLLHITHGIDLVPLYGMATADAHGGLPLSIFEPEANKVTNITDLFFLIKQT